MPSNEEWFVIWLLAMILNGFWLLVAFKTNDAVMGTLALIGFCAALPMGLVYLAVGLAEISMALEKNKNAKR